MWILGREVKPAITRRGSLWLRKPNPKILRDYESVEAFHAECRRMAEEAQASQPLIPTPTPQTGSIRPVLAAWQARMAAQPATLPAPTPAEQQVDFYSDPVHVVPQTVSWNGIVLQWPTYDEQCPTPWDGENTMAAPDRTDRCEP